MVHARFLLGCELSEGTTERRVEEKRIVAEAVVPTRRVGDHALGDALGRVLPAGGVHEGDHAAEARRPLLGRDTTERLEEEGAPGRVVEPGAAEPRGANAGRSPERVHLDAGIVAECPRSDEPRGGARLPERIGAVGVASLLREPGAWQLGECPDLVGDVPQERDELARLGRVQRGEDEKRPSG